MNVLLIAPHMGSLNVEEEVQAIMNSGLKVTSLIGNVTHIDVLREVEKSYDILWLCTHGTEEGIQLSDGILNSSLLVALTRDKFRLIVLNTCSSWKVAQMIQNETSAEVIATVIDVPDREAFQTGTIFARELAKVANFERAYYKARPGNNRTYIRLAGRTVVNERGNSNVDETAFHELQMAVYGNPRINFSGIMNELKEIRRIVDDLSSKMISMQEGGKERAEIITEVKDEMTQLKKKINQLDGTIGWKPHPILVGLVGTFGAILVIGELIRLLAYFF